MINLRLRSLNKFKYYYRYNLTKSILDSVLLSTTNVLQLNGQKRLLSLGIVGAPFSKGQTKHGVQMGPNAIREAGLIRQLKLLGHDVIDFGDFNSNTNAINHNINSNRNAFNKILNNESMVREMCSQLEPFVKNVAESERIPITLGGDHSIAMGSISGNATLESNRDMCVVWVDAHADINTVLTTKTGNFHGMPVSFILREVQQNLGDPNKDCFLVEPHISARNLAFIGLRDVESHEMDILNELKIIYFSMKDIDKLGIHEVVARTLDKINPNLTKRIHVSFDIDSVDQTLAPSTGTPVPAGLSLRESLCIGEEIANTGLLCGLDMVEVNPLIGNENDVNKTVNCALNIILSFLGKSRTHLYATNFR